MKDKLTIAIDYDDTFTADTRMWCMLIETMQSFGHRVICISARRNELNQRRELEAAYPAGVEILLSYGTPKREFAKTHGIEVDIWCDDMPEGIPTKSDMIAMCG